MKRIGFIIRLYKRYGLRNILFLATTKFKKSRTSNTKIRGIKHPVTLSNFKEDVATLAQIFFNEEYKINKEFAAEFIIDCGANIGLSAVYFANKYPSAKIVAIEPDENNYYFLQLNAKPYPNILCLNRAIWPRPVHMQVVDAGRGGWGLQTRETGDATGIESITIDEIMHQQGANQIDLLKIDIEGAEKELFMDGYEDWLAKTKCIAIELHDFLEPGISEIFFKAVAPYGFKIHEQGENIICIK